MQSLQVKLNKLKVSKIETARKGNHREGSRAAGHSSIRNSQTALDCKRGVSNGRGELYVTRRTILFVISSTNLISRWTKGSKQSIGGNSGTMDRMKM